MLIRDANSVYDCCKNCGHTNLQKRIYKIFLSEDNYILLCGECTFKISLEIYKKEKYTNVIKS